MWQTIKNWFKSLFSRETAEKVIHGVRDAVITTASETVDGFINDPANQEAARQAITSVAAKGLTGNKALNEAVQILKDNGLAAGRTAANTLLRTLVQLVFATLKLA